jgi:hypothetical protein
MAKALRGNQRFVKNNPTSCGTPIEIKVATPFGDATGSFDPIQEKTTMRIPTGKTTFKTVTLSTKDDFWTLAKDGVTESSGTFVVETGKQIDPVRPAKDEDSVSKTINEKEKQLPIGQE